MKKNFGIILFIVVAVLGYLSTAVYTVDETEQAILLQMGRPVGEGAIAPGLHVKAPAPFQNAITFERRLLDYDANPAEILTADKKNLVVDNYAKWKIVDPLRFYRTVRNVPSALSRLDDIIFAELRVELGRHTMANIISKKREQIMDSVTERAASRSRDYGIEVVDVRIKRADLPQENERAVFGRMQAEREREAKRYRSEGQEAALKLRAEADRKRTLLLADAYKRSQELRGEGDAKAAAVFAEAYGQDYDFFRFQRSLQAYEKSLDQGLTLVFSEDDQFLEILNQGRVPKQESGQKPEAAPGVTP
jgi:membrane protease subunit HflC